MLDSHAIMYYTLELQANSWHTSVRYIPLFPQWIDWQLHNTLVKIFALNMPKWQYEHESVYFSLISYLSY